MSRKIRAALTQTVNAFKEMPSRIEDLCLLEGRLEEIRRANVEHHCNLIEQAARQGVRAICLGELFSGPYFAINKLPLWLGLAESAEDGPTVTELKETAARNHIIIVAPIYEFDSKTGHRFNTAVVMSDEGKVLGKYRKTHIPCGENEQGRFVETFYYGRSDESIFDCNRTDANISSNPYFPVFKTSIGNLGVAICYDRHFEGVIYSLAKEGAELIFSPAVTFGNKSERMWMLEFPTDAARHNVFIGGSNRKGKETPWNQEYFGKSYFCGPNGNLENMSHHDNLIISEINFDELKSGDPSGWNLPRDIRYEIYSKRETTTG